MTDTIRIPNTHPDGTPVPGPRHIEIDVRELTRELAEAAILKATEEHLAKRQKGSPGFNDPAMCQPSNARMLDCALRYRIQSIAGEPFDPSSLNTEDFRARWSERQWAELERQVGVDVGSLKRRKVA